MEAIKAFLTLGFSFGKMIEALADGFQFTDLGAILDAAKAIPGGLAAAPAALAAYFQMSDEDALPLENWVVATFDLKDDAVEAAIESCLKVVIELHSLVKLIAKK